MDRSKFSFVIENSFRDNGELLPRDPPTVWYVTIITLCNVERMLTSPHRRYDRLPNLSSKSTLTINISLCKIERHFFWSDSFVSRKNAPNEPDFNNAGAEVAKLNDYHQEVFGINVHFKSFI